MARAVASDVSGQWPYSVQTAFKDAVQAAVPRLALEVISGKPDDQSPADAAEALSDIALGDSYLHGLDEFSETTAEKASQDIMASLFDLLTDSAPNRSQYITTETLIRHAVWSDDPGRLDAVFALYPGIQAAVKDAVAQLFNLTLRNVLESMTIRLTSGDPKVMEQLLTAIQEMEVVSLSFYKDRLRPATAGVAKNRICGILLDLLKGLYREVSSIMGK